MDDLRYSTLAPSNRAHFTLNQLPYASPVFTTASQSPTWLPSTPQASQTAQFSQPQQTPPPDPRPSDFVLFPSQSRRSFEAFPSARNTPNTVIHDASGATSRRHSSFLSGAPTLQNQRVAEIIHGTGHPTTSAAFNRRFNLQQTPFYASSAPSSSATLQSQQPRGRPPVPRFSQSAPLIPVKQETQTSSIHQGKQSPSEMRFHDSHKLDMSFLDFDATYGNGAMADSFGPAVPTAYEDNMMVRTSSNVSSTHVGTVSPQDLMLRDGPFSAPNSAAFTNLTSPDSMYHVSPAFNDGLDASPMFCGTNLDENTGDAWYSLFENDALPAQSTTVQHGLTGLTAEDETALKQQMRAAHRRSASSPKSPTGSTKASSISGVAARKRNQPLPPIVVDDPDDIVKVKRARNTLAARKSRAKKAETMESMQREIDRLNRELNQWKQLAIQHGVDANAVQREESAEDFE